MMNRAPHGFGPHGGGFYGGPRFGPRPMMRPMPFRRPFYGYGWHRPRRMGGGLLIGLLVFLAFFL